MACPLLQKDNYKPKIHIKLMFKDILILDVISCTEPTGYAAYLKESSNTEVEINGHFLYLRV
jgi:hypothetical protein